MVPVFSIIPAVTVIISLLTVLFEDFLSTFSDLFLFVIFDAFRFNTDKMTESYLELLSMRDYSQHKTISKM